MSVLASLVAVGLAAGFFVVNHRRDEETASLADITRANSSAPPPVDVVTATPSPASQQLVLPGETAAWYESQIYARVSGYVGKWFVDIGDAVKKDQVLAQIETPDLDAELAASRAKLAAGNAEVTVKQSDADFAKTTYDRWRDSPQGVVSEQERESKKAGFNGSNAQLAAAKAQVALYQADVDRLTALTAFKEVRAPYDGVITQRHIDIGNLVTAGSTSSTTALYRIASDDPIRVFVDVPQSASSDILKGDATAKITIGDGSGQSYQGKVTRTSRAINPQARTLRTEVDIPNVDRKLVPGLYVNVTFTLKAAEGVRIPAAALMFRPGPQVAVVQDGTIQFRTVTIGVDDGSVVQISSGLKEGESVALNLSSQISSGEKVEARNLKQANASGAPAPKE